MAASGSSSRVSLVATHDRLHPMKGDGSGRDGQLPELLLELPPFLMLEILRAGRRAAEASERGPRLHHISVLACLEEFGPQSQREVAGRLRRDPSDLVAVIDQLEREGHARR